MASTITTAAASQVNRRFLLLAFILGLLAAVLIYAWMSRSTSSSGGAAGDVPVVVAKGAIPPGTRITADLVEVRQIPQSAVGADAIASTELVIGQVTRYPVASGEYLLSSKLVATTVPSNTALSYVIEPGMRAVAIHIEQVSDAGGLVLPGDHVDVIWVPVKGGPAFVLMSDVEVTAVSQTIVDIAPSAPGLSTNGSTEPTTSTRTRNSDAKALPDASTATLLVSPADAVNLLCAESFASGSGGVLRMALRAFGDTAPVAPNAPACPARDLAAQFGG